jgi:TatD DNase family protein
MSALTSSASSAMSSTLRFVDIGANLLDERFTAGVYRSTFRHEPDLDDIIRRAVATGVNRIVLTAGTVLESRQAVRTARELRAKFSPDCQFYSTVGVHPTRCLQVFQADSDEHDSNGDNRAAALLEELLEIARDGMMDHTVVAIGEIGLDYDRLDFCPADVQKKYLIAQLKCLAEPTGLPLFLHNRNVCSDLFDILCQYRHLWSGSGVVHSFDDSLELARNFINELNLYIGLNGCSLRTDESLRVARELPLNRILLETDSPYCEVKKTHPGYSYIQTHWLDAKVEKKFERGKTVKSRQEPCHIIQVAEVVAGVKQLPLKEVAGACYQNSLDLYGWRE